MHYEEARELEGHWNWTTIDDRIGMVPFVIPPCLHGGAHCDHATSTEAERHRYDYELNQIRFYRLSGEHRWYRCDYPGCVLLETVHSVWPGGYRFDSLCDLHANLAAIRDIVPFAPGLISVHA